MKRMYMGEELKMNNEWWIRRRITKARVGGKAEREDWKLLRKKGWNQDGRTRRDILKQ